MDIPRDITRSPVHSIIMFSCESIPDFYSSESTISQYTRHWPYEQNQPIPSHQILRRVESSEMVTNHNNYTTWHSPHVSVQIEQKLSLEATHFHDASFQHTPVQYTPLTPEPVPYPVFNLPRPHQNNTVMAKRHRAMISFVPTKTGNFKTIVKRKRKRTVFTTEQVEALEEIFKRKQYITREDREVIVNQLQLNDKPVKIWFQNRRLKDKKGTEQIEEERAPIFYSTEVSSRDAAKLDNVESKINEKTDEFGYVTLDDSLIRDLFNVIDDVLTNKTQHFPSEHLTEKDSNPVYEPISPASVSDSTDEESTSYWQPSEPNESLQRLFDLQTMFSL